MRSSEEVTAADIARLAGVGRAAVSNWRRRHADFPNPVGGTRVSPTFSLDEVERWLFANGRLQPDANSPTGDSATPTATVTSPTALWLASLLPPLTAGVVIDPAASSGAALEAAAGRFGDQLTYIAECFTAADFAAVERALAGGNLKTCIVMGEPFDDTLAEYLGSVDAVVSIPPGGHHVALNDVFHHCWEFGPPPKSDPSLAWIQTAYAFLKPGGVAAVAVPFGAATRASGRRIRAELLRAGVLTHVIALPEYLPGPSQIWLLRRPTWQPTYILRMVDLADAHPAGLPRSPTDWQTIFDDPGSTHDIPSIELLDEDVLLVPSTHVTRPPRDVGPEYCDLADTYSALARGIARRQAPVFETTTPVDLPTVGIADLQRAGALEIRDWHDAEPGDVIVPSGSDRFEAVTVATQPDDKPRAGVVIRCDPTQIDPYFLACFLRSEANRRQAFGTQSGSFRLDLRRARVPRIPLTQQHNFGEAFQRLTEFATRANELASTANGIVRTAVYGLTAGVLTTSGDSEDTGDHPG